MGLLSKNTSSSLLTLCYLSPSTASAGNNTSSTEMHCVPKIGIENDCLYGTPTFWSFILLMCIGTIGFNVANSVSDATCFEMLGEKTMEYGAQRVWGTIGFGATALVSGIVVHLYQNDVSSAVRSIAPAIIIMLIFGIFDIISIKWLHLPQFSNEGESIMSKVVHLLSQKSIAIFLVFATLAGILDSFIIYYMFWHLEEVAERTGLDKTNRGMCRGGRMSRRRNSILPCVRQNTETHWLRALLDFLLLDVFHSIGTNFNHSESVVARVN